MNTGIAFKQGEDFWVTNLQHTKATKKLIFLRAIFMNNNNNGRVNLIIAYSPIWIVIKAVFAGWIL